MSLLGFVLAGLIGITLGMLGGGGALLTVPVLVYVLHFPAKQAVAMSLPVIGIVALVGAIGHWRRGTVRAAVALPFGAAAMAGTLAGAQLSRYLAGSTQLLLLGIVMLVSAAAMFRGSPSAAPGTVRVRLAGMLAVGTGVGVLSGLVGIGGGFLIVPALVLLAGLSMPQAVGTSLTVIAMNAAAGTVAYLGSESVPWGFLAVFAAMALGGLFAGTWFGRRVAAATLRRAFSVFLVVVGVFILYQNLHAIAA